MHASRDSTSHSPSLLSRFTPAAFFQLQKRVDGLHREVRMLKESGHSVRELVDSDAKLEVVRFLGKAKAAGRQSVSDFEVADALNLPLEQVGGILSGLLVEKRGR